MSGRHRLPAHSSLCHLSHTLSYVQWCLAVKQPCGLLSTVWVWYENPMFVKYMETTTYPTLVLTIHSPMLSICRHVYPACNYPITTLLASAIKMYLQTRYKPPVCIDLILSSNEPRWRPNQLASLNKSTEIDTWPFLIIENNKKE